MKHASPTRRSAYLGVRTAALDRSPVRETFDTGVRALNALTTFGIGQRIGVMAGSGVGKSVLIDMIARGSSADIVVVGLIGERAREVSDFVERHMNAEKKDKPIVVAVPADHARSEERRVGKEGVRTCRSRWSRVHSKKKNN